MNDSSEKTEPTIISKRLITSTLHQLSSIPYDPSKPPTQPLPNSTSFAQAYSTPKPAPINPIKSLPPPHLKLAKSAFLTLHFLFSFDFLPALDLIDRSLIQKLTCLHPTSPAKSITTFYVQSASAVATATRGGKGSGRFGNRNYAATRVHYEVRLDSWNCSCPAFSAAGLRLILLDGEDSLESGRERSDEEGEPGVVTNSDTVEESHPGSGDGGGDTPLLGGLATKDDALVPVCKHILSAALCDAAPAMFGHGMNSREVSRQEMAAWAAGWGET